MFERFSVGGTLECCPVSGCFCSVGSGHTGMGAEALKTHVDDHLLGIIEGQVPAEWMRARGWVICPHCSKSASSSRRGGVHETCAAEARAMQFGGRDEWAHLDDAWEQGGLLVFGYVMYVVYSIKFWA